MRYVVFDIETQNTFEDVGKHDPALLDLSVASVYDSASDAYTTVTETELELLWPIFERAEAIVGYNSNHFDIPILDKYYPGSLKSLRSIDLLESVKASFGKRLRLNSIAEATLGTAKGGSGLQAIAWWKQGEIEKIKTYCQKDVEITKDLFEYARKHGKVSVQDGLKKRDIPIDTSSWHTAAHDGAMTHTLPF